MKSSQLGNSAAEIAKILGREQWGKFLGFWKSKIKKKTIGVQTPEGVQGIRSFSACIFES